MEVVHDAVNTISGATAETEARPAGVATLPTGTASRNGKGRGTGRTTRAALGTAAERLAILLIELGNCQTVGIRVNWKKSQTPPARILLAISGATICPKCGAFLLLNETGAVICQKPGCEWAGVEYMPDAATSQMPDVLAIESTG